MRRRRLLALGAAAVGSAGCVGIGDGSDGAGLSTPPETTRQPATTPTATESPSTTSVGGSLNGRPYRIDGDLHLVEESGTEWIHAFLDVRRKYDENVTPAEDPDVLALRRIGRETDAKLFVSLQWNFIGIFGEQSPVHVPRTGTERAREMIQLATELLAAIEEPVAIVGLGNEPIWETLDRDFLGYDTPLVPFTRAVKDHLVEHYTAGEPRFLLGAFNRLFTEHARQKYGPFYDELLEMARTDEDVDGIDLHVHYERLEQAEEMLSVARESFPDGMVTATEFSPMWRYDQHKDERIRGFPGGEDFAERYGVESGTTVTQYFEAAKYDQLSTEEMAEFMETMPWYNVAFVEDMHDLLSAHDVEVGTFGFLVEGDVRNIDWTEGWAPFPINCLFQPVLIDTPDGAHPHYLDDFRERA